MVDGQVREHGPWLVDRQREREDETTRLLVLAEPVDRRSAEFCSEVAEAIAALFARESLSITGGLLRALQQAHTNLAEWNRRSLREHRVAVGVTCVVIRDGEATIAQVGPSAAYLSGARGVTRLTTEGLPAAAPLGGSAEIEPRFTATDIHGREILLLTSTVEQIVGLRGIEESISAGPEAALAELFRRTRDVTDLTAVLIADLDLPDGADMPAPLDLDDDEDVAGREIVMPGIDSGNRTPAPRVTSAPEPEPRRRRWSGPQSQPIPFPSIRRPARTVGRTPLEQQLPWRWIGIGAGALLALGILAWAVGPGLLREDRQAELTKIITTAQEQLSAAQGAQRADDRRKALQNVLVSTERARALAPSDARVTQIETLVQSQLAVMDAVTDVGTVSPFMRFAGVVTDAVNPKSIVVGGRSLWFIEEAKGRVIRIDGASPPTVEEVYREGQSYNGTRAQGPVALAWDAQGSRLLVMDAARGLFAIPEASKTPTPLPLRGASELRSNTAIAVYQRNLYVLDPSQGEVWRYLPASDGYDSERSAILGGVDIARTTSLVVDGDVFLVDDARLRRFRGGKETIAMLDGLDTPLKAPTALVEDVQRGLLFVADRGNKRIVVGDREGKFLKQYRHPSFSDLRGLAISPDGSRLYVMSGDGITFFDVAPAGPPPTQPSPTATPTTATGATGTATPARTPTPTATPAR